jgi:DNA-binding winged helix-turn-helix (wHTH) protein
MRYVFADCIFDTRLYTLSRGGTAVRLRPKAFHVLQYLLEHRDRVVTKDELCAQVWPSQFISDATLEGCITLARRAIGDSGRGQRLITRRRGYGYRFVGVVQEEVVQPSEVLRTSGVGDVAHEPALSLPPAASSQGLPVQSVPEGERKLVHTPQLHPSDGSGRPGGSGS